MYQAPSWALGHQQWSQLMWPALPSWSYGPGALPLPPSEFFKFLTSPFPLSMGRKQPADLLLWLFPFFPSSDSHASCLTGEMMLLDSDKFMSFDCLWSSLINSLQTSTGNWLWVLSSKASSDESWSTVLLPLESSPSVLHSLHLPDSQQRHSSYSGAWQVVSVA